MRKFISHSGLGYRESRCVHCGEEPGTMGDKHETKERGVLTDCPLSRTCCSFCKHVFSGVPDVNTRLSSEGGEALRPTGYHVKEVCPYMKAKFQLYLADIISRMTGLRPMSKDCVPVGGSSAPNMVASAPAPSSQMGSQVEQFTGSLRLF